jgi:hypothetical protein
MVPVIVRRRHRFTVFAAGHQAGIGNSMPTPAPATPRCLQQALSSFSRQVQRDYQHIDDHPHVPAARPRARAMVGRLSRPHRRRPASAARAAGARARGRPCARLHVRQWLDYSKRA